MRYYLKHSAAFDYPPYTYHTDIYKEAVRKAGRKNVRTAREFGWSNMPSVVTWSVDDDDIDTQNSIQEALSNCPPFAGGNSLPCPIIHEKDW